MGKHAPPRTRGADEKRNLAEKPDIAPPVLGRLARGENGRPVGYRRDGFYPLQEWERTALSNVMLLVDECVAFVARAVACAMLGPAAAGRGS